MDSFYLLLFVAFAIPAAVLEYTQNGCFGQLSELPHMQQGATKAQYLRFRNNYVLVFSLMMAGDWLQGPYVYHLYESYGFSVKAIGQLFIMGFGSSALLGTIIGSLADRHGRKRAGLLYVLTYSLSCLTKHSRHFWVLMVGRLLGGISTSLLFSSFESWVVAAHTARGFDESLLSDVFTKAVFLGNGVMAILSGLLGNVLAVTLKLGPVAPFDAAIVVLLAGGAVVAMTWDENTGDVKHHEGGLASQLRKAVQAIATDERIALLGAMQSLFEAAMYCMIFLWTPALSATGDQLPHGFIFAIFMTASMVGTALAGQLLLTMRVERYMQGVFWLSAISLFIPVLFHTEMAESVKKEVLLNESGVMDMGHGDTGSMHGFLSMGAKVQLLAFCAFEVFVGVFWPSMMTMRATYVPEDMRSTIMNVFRIPLNLFVCVILWKVSDFPLGFMFAICSMFLVAAAACQLRLCSITEAVHVAVPAVKVHATPEPTEEVVVHVAYAAHEANKQRGTRAATSSVVTT